MGSVTEFHRRRDRRQLQWPKGSATLILRPMATGTGMLRLLARPTATTTLRGMPMAKPTLKGMPMLPVTQMRKAMGMVLAKRCRYPMHGPLLNRTSRMPRRT